jgi:hypothetical protein
MARATAQCVFLVVRKSFCANLPVVAMDPATADCLLQQGVEASALGAPSELVVVVLELDIGCMIETRLLPSSLAATHRGFAFCLADPIGSAADFRLPRLRKARRSTRNLLEQLR